MAIECYGFDLGYEAEYMHESTFCCATQHYEKFRDIILSRIVINKINKPLFNKSQSIASYQSQENWKII